MAWLGDLLIRLKAETADFQQDMGKAALSAERSMNQMQAAAGKLGAALSLVGFEELVRRSIDFGDRLNDLSKVTSITVEDLAGLGVAAKQSGGNLESVGLSVQKMSVNMAKHADKFRELGITTKDPLEAFKQLSDMFVSIQDPELRAAMAAAALGKSWQGAAPLLAEGSKRIGEMVAAGSRASGMTKDIAMRSDEFNDKLVLLIGSGGLFSSVANQMLPILNVMADEFLDARDNADKAKDSFSPLTVAMQAIVVTASEAGFVVATFGEELARLAAKGSTIDFKKFAVSPVYALYDASKKGWDDIDALFKERQDKRVKDHEDFMKRIMGLGTVKQEAAKIKPGDAGAADSDGQPWMLRDPQADAARARKFIETAEKTAALEKRQSAAIQEMENKRKHLFGTTEEALMQERLYGQQVDVGDGKLRHFKGTYEEFDPVVKAWLNTKAKEIDAFKAHIAVVDSAYAAMRALAEAQQKVDSITQDSMHSFHLQNEELQFQISLIGKTIRQQELLTASRQIDLASQERIRQKIAALPQDEMLGADPQAVDKILADEKKMADAQKKTYGDLLRTRQESERSWATGAKQAFNDYVENATNAAAQANMLFSNAFRNMEDALVNFVKTGKLDFKSLADSIISDIIRIQVRAAMAQVLGGGGGGLGGLISGGGFGGGMSGAGGGGLLGGLGDKISGLFQDNSPVVDAYGDALPDLADLFAVPGFAGGGSPPVGVPSMVGEDGPELFVPNIAGTIVPNSEMGGAAGPTVYIDARGADAAGMARLERAVLEMHGSFNRRSVAAAFDAQRRGVTS